MHGKAFVLAFALAAAHALMCAAPAEGSGGGARPQRRASSARRAAPSKVTQEEVVRFPRLGEVRVRAVEARGRQPRVEFASAATGRLLFSATLGSSDPESFRPTLSPGVSPIEPFVRFTTVSADGLPSPMVAAVAVRPGGSDHGFETTLIGEVAGRLKVLTPEPGWTPIQGGVFVGDLGGGRGPGMAVWEFIWADDEAHYDRHRYAARLYKFDRRRAVFRRFDALRSKEKHESGEAALEGMKLPRYANLLDNFPAIKEYRN